MSILRISCSPRGHGAESFQLSERVVGHLLAQHPDATVVNRKLTPDAIAHIDGDHAAAVQGGWRRTDGRGAMAHGTLRESDRLIAELEACDCLVIATPMHNFTVPSVLKAWIDHVVRAHSTFAVTPSGKVGNLPDRPVFIAVSSGRSYAGETARQPDFLTPYLTSVLNTIGLFDITFFSIQGTTQGGKMLTTTRNNVRTNLARYFTGRSVTFPAYRAAHVYPTMSSS